MNKQIKIIVTAIMIALSFGHLQAQTYESRNYIKIPPDREIIKTMKANKCPEVLDSGYVVHHEFKRKLKDIEYTISKTDSSTRDTSCFFDKEIKVKLKSLPGKANLTVDEKDPSLFLVNYWLNPKHVLPSGTTLHYEYRVLGCDSNMKFEKEEKQLLKKKTKIFMFRISNNDTIQDWYKYSDLILKTYNGEKLTGVYANMYDRSGQYTLKLENRDFFSYAKRAFEFSALTIPFKYRFGYEKTVEGVDIKVKDEFIADLNIGAYGGYQIGKYRLRREGNKLRELAKLGGSVGGFITFSTVALDSLNTTAGTEPFSKDEKSTIGIISPGLAAMFTLYNFQIGGFAGWDLAIGQDRKNWNHNNRFWLGFGFGYNLGGFWKK